MPHRYDWFVHDANVKRYRQQLMGATTPEQHKMLIMLLAEEAAIAKAKGWFAPTE